MLSLLENMFCDVSEGESLWKILRHDDVLIQNKRRRKVFHEQVFNSVQDEKVTKNPSGKFRGDKRITLNGSKRKIYPMVEKHFPSLLKHKINTEYFTILPWWA